jgi:hypothetical protein
MTNRTGLYVMVFITMLNSCDASTDAKKTADALKRIADAIPAASARPASPDAPR